MTFMSSAGAWLDYLRRMHVACGRDSAPLRPTEADIEALRRFRGECRADQFGDGPDVVLAAPGDPMHARYRMEWDRDFNPGIDSHCAAVAGELGVTWTGEEDFDAQNRNRRERGYGWWLADTSAYAACWRDTLDLAEAARDDYAEYARAILSGLATPDGAGPRRG